MGLTSRDYFRDETARHPGWLSGAPACKWLIAITCATFLLQLVLTEKPVVELTPAGPVRAAPVSLMDEWFAVDPVAVARGQVWRLITNAFLHSRHDPLHLLFNMLVLWWFGSTVESLYGSREFTWFYLTAALIGGLGFTLWGWWMRDPTPAIGASGAVMAVLMLFACHFPHSRIYLFGIIGIEARWLVALYAFFDLYPVLLELGGGMRSGRIAHVIHLSGLAVGWLYYTRQWRLSKGWAGWNWRRLFPRPSASAELKVFHPEPSSDDGDFPFDLDAEVDRILAKIHDQGSESLTAHERAILTRASERYKRRR
jgi:membrane associated rhomboid family serine protease